MKKFIAIFEEFEEAIDDLYSEPNKDVKYDEMGKELLGLANNYVTEEIPIDIYDPKYETPTRLTDLKDDLIVFINDKMGEKLAQAFADEAMDLLSSYGISEKKQTPKIKEKHLFKKTNNIPDNGVKASAEMKTGVSLSKPGKTPKMSVRKK